MTKTSRIIHQLPGTIMTGKYILARLGEALEANPNTKVCMFIDNDDETWNELICRFSDRELLWMIKVVEKDLLDG